MIEVSKDEAFYIREFSNSHVAMASRSKRSTGKTYYAVEESIVFSLLKEFRENPQEAMKRLKKRIGQK